MTFSSLMRHRPTLKIYITVLDAELPAMNWELLDLLAADCALQVQQIDEDLRASATEEPIGGMPKGR